MRDQLSDEGALEGKKPMNSAPYEVAVSRHCAGLAGTLWDREWQTYCSVRKQGQLRRRTIIALATLAEPAQLEWNEVFMDVAWLAWVEVVADARRERKLPAAQRAFEMMRADLHMCGTNAMSGDQLRVLLKQVAPTIPATAIGPLISSIPHDAGGRISLSSFFDWLYSEAACRAPGEDETASWQREWQMHCKQRRDQQLRRGAILTLALISVPLELEWNEVFMDAAWSAWAECVADARRQRALPAAQRLFERSAEASVY
mmetsp:Transcript_131550/g.281229  ORF Transcript_131550/g.281229 Transcript_131550/m.281229 type:complete len:259 (+) Transcript_131550:120-896(+)